MLLIINFMILGFVVIMILGDYNVVLNCVYAVLHSRSYKWITFRIRDILFHETGLKRLNFCCYIHWYTIASAIAVLLAAYPIIAIIQVLMGYVHVSPMFFYDSAVDTPSCNRIDGIPNIDALLGWTTRILVILMVPPVVYCVADILVPRYFLDESFNVINNTTTAVPAKNTQSQLSTPDVSNILCCDELDEVNVKSGDDAATNMFQNPINVTDITKNNSHFYLLCPALFDCYVWLMSYLQVDLWFISLLHAWFKSDNAINKSQEIEDEEKEFDAKCASNTIDRTVIFPDLAIAEKLDLQQKWVYFMRKKLPTYSKFSKRQCDPMFKFIEQSVECCRVRGKEFVLFEYIGYPIIVVIGYSAYFFSFIVSYSGYGHLLTEDGRLLWYLVLQKYIVFLKVSLLGIWTEAEYKAFGILNHEYSINMNFHLHSAIETAIKSKCVTSAPPTYAPTYAPISYDPSVLVHSLISVRAVLYLLIPKLSLICVYCKNTAAYPLFTDSVSREIKGLSADSCIKRIFTDAVVANHNFLDRQISINFLPLWAPNIESDIDPAKSTTSYVLYWMNYINVMMNYSRMIQWSYGVYLTGVSMGILFSPDSSGWSYSLMAIVFPMAVINSFQAVIFFGHYFNVVGVELPTNLDDKIVEITSQKPRPHSGGGPYAVVASNDELAI